VIIAGERELLEHLKGILEAVKEIVNNKVVV